MLRRLPERVHVLHLAARSLPANLPTNLPANRHLASDMKVGDSLAGLPEYDK